MIDKLELSKALEGGPIDRAKAEAMASAIADHVRDLEVHLIRRDLAVVKWMLGANLTVTLLILGKLFLGH